MLLLASVFFSFIATFVNVLAITVTAPSPGEQVSLAKPFMIRWALDSGDPAQVSIDLLNSSNIVAKPILENIAHSLNASELGANITWPFNIPNETATYQLYFIAAASGSDIATSGIFSLTLPPGENRTQAAGTVGPYGTHPSTDFPPSAKESRLSSRVIAGIVCSFVVLFLVGIFTGCFIYRKRRHVPAKEEENNEIGKPELDGSSPNEKRGTLDTMASAEIGSSDKPFNYLRFELPSSPPIPPVELPDNEIPAYEMSSAADTSTIPDTEEKSYEEQDRLDVTLTTETSEGIRNHVQSPQSRSMSISSLSSGTKFPASTFAKALEEIVAEEFRRKDSDE
ncbi:hypothetical protein BT63DRAFT_55079 [Microthyrium microscopicum]|uniref:Yeast cell wall synthesis Kre9/Knh1-like N-terminal domain-containing protein n=1 Tax=Microthyrium microscopicum TaxID=703497 RepID=A0A6A6U3W4_9PEZI|nr:hypothetical protein BT63DRAFT_55079 [Microthyrium microscopicum]